MKLLNFCIFSYFSLSVLPFYIKKRREAGSGKHGNRVWSFTVIGAKDDRRARICAKNSADLGADLHQEQRGFGRGSARRVYGGRGGKWRMRADAAGLWRR